MASRAREICMLGCVLLEIHRLASRCLYLHSFESLKITPISKLLLSDLKNTLRAEIPPVVATEHRQRQDSVFARKCMHFHTPYHISSSKEYGTWLSSQQPSIFNAWWPKDQACAKLNECPHKTRKASTLSCTIKGDGDQEMRHVSSLQVWNAPRFSYLD